MPVMAAGVAVKAAASAGVPGWAIGLGAVVAVGAVAWWAWHLPLPGSAWSARRTWALAVT